MLLTSWRAIFDGMTAEHYFICGNSLLELRDYPEAVAAFEKAITLAPSVKEPYYNAAVAYIKMEDHQSAIGKFEKLLNIDPDDKRIKRNLAGLYVKIGERQRAEQYLYEANL